MSVRGLPARPNLDHLKNEAKALQRAFVKRDGAAVARVVSVLGELPQLKLTEAQHVVAREYGFASWAKLRLHVQALRGVDERVSAFLDAVAAQNSGRANEIALGTPEIARVSLAVAAVLGNEGEVRRMIAAEATLLNARVGSMGAPPLVWLCYSPFHGESAERDAGLAACAHALLDAGADPNLGDSRYGIAGLYAVTGARSVPRIARILLESGANPNDGESAFHAAEHFHEDALALLMEFGADLNKTGEWGNTPLYFLLRYWNVERMPQVKRGVSWLLAHGADPNVVCARERETSLHVAARRGQHENIVKLLLDHGADVNARRGDGRSALVLARRGGFDVIVALLETAGSVPEPLSDEDLLMQACARGDQESAKRLATPEITAGLDAAVLRLLPEAADSGRLAVVRACLAAGFPVGTTDENGATALHYAGITGNGTIVRELIRAGADLTIRDPEHHATPLGWACFGADNIRTEGGDYVDVVRALMDAGARLAEGEEPLDDPRVAEVIRAYG